MCGKLLRIEIHLYLKNPRFYIKVFQMVEFECVDDFELTKEKEVFHATR